MPLPKFNKQRNENVPQNGTETGSISNGVPRPHEGIKSLPKESGIIPAEVRKKWVDRLVECLDATRFVWDRPSGQFKEEPDHATRLKAVELAAAYDVGRPVERKVTLTGDFTNYDTKLEKLLSTPEGLRFAIAAGIVEPLEKSAKARRGTGSISTPESQQGGGEADIR